MSNRRPIVAGNWKMNGSQAESAALLAGMVTLTPGTVSVDLDLKACVLTVHVLLVDDEAATLAQIKQRYEARIKEIFQC